MITNSDIDVLSRVHLSNHFTLGEMLNTSYLALQRYPTSKQLINLVLLCAQMEVVRTFLNRPIYISSGYRSALLNKKVGGVDSSGHTLGNAADFPCSEAEFFKLKANIEYDQLIFYKKRSFCHLGIADVCRHQAFVYNS